jgi:hypothetical protein
MAIPTKKIYGRNGKLIFDPNNPEDVRRQEEINKQIEMAKELFSIVDPRGGGGLGAMARGMSKVVSKAVAKETVKKAAKSTTKRSSKKVTTTENKVEKPNLTLENLKKALNPSSGLPGSLPKVGNNKSLSASNKSLTSNTPKSRTVQKTLPAGEESKSVIKTATPKIKTISDFMKQQSEVITPLLPSVKTLPSGSKNISNTMELAQVPGSSVPDKIKSLYDQLVSSKPKQSGIVETVKNVRELAEKQVKNAPTTTPIKKGPTREEMKAIYQKNQKATNIAKDIVANNKLKTELEKLREANKPFYEKSINEAITKSNKKIGIGTGIAGGLTAAGYAYYGPNWVSAIQSLSNKSNKQTTSPVDLKRINPDKITPSKIEGVSIVKGSDGKDYGIKWNNTTKSWEYYRGGGSAPIDNNNQNKGNNQGSNKSETTTPRSATGQSFDKAFAEARKQASGAGGIFEWNGKKYGTALKGETVPKNRVEVGKKEEYPTFESDPSLATLRQQDDDKQLLARAKAQMMEFEPTEVLPTKPLSSLVFKTTNRRDEQAALYNIEADNKLPLKKKRYGGNLAMLKYMK